MIRTFSLLIFLLFAAGLAHGAEPGGFPLVDIHALDKTIAIELRYAGPKNIAGRPLYPPGTKAMTRPELAQCLAAAQKMLNRYDYSLKIWDAYRPVSVQHELWAASRNNLYVADPDAGAGSLHTWGLAVDATLVRANHKPVKMPTDFDDFTPAAMWKYNGPDHDIWLHLRLLQIAMGRSGFYGLRSEWWHFTIQQWKQLLPPEESKKAVQALSDIQQRNL